MGRRRRAPNEQGFTLVELLVATSVLVVVMTAIGPLFYGAMRLTGVTNQRSQATNLAVAATEQMRSLSYPEVGYGTTPSACTNNSETPVTLSSTGPLDALPTSTVEGHTTYTIVRCVYWAASSIPGSQNAYKQTVVKVSWAAPGGVLAVSQTSALYPGGYNPPVTVPSTTVPGGQILPLVCQASRDPGNPTSIIDLSWTPAVGSSPPSDYVLYYTTSAPVGAITAGPYPYTTSAAIYGTATTVTVGPGTTYYFQVAAVASDGTTSAPSGTCSASTTSNTIVTTTHNSVSSATALVLALAGATTPYTVTSGGTTATNGGSLPDTYSKVQPTLALPGADSAVTVTAATEIAAANHDGTSYSCAGLLSSGQTLTGGSPSSGCSVSGSGTGGVSINLAGLPGVGSAISSLVAGLKLNLNGATSSAGSGADGASITWSASLIGASVTVTPLGGLLPPQTIPLSLPPALTSPTDVVQAITTAIGNSTLSSLAAPLQAALAPVLVLTGSYHSQTGAYLIVSALHIAVLGGAGTGDLATSTVGPNGSTTTSTVPPCSIYGLVVSPSTGPGGGGVPLTSSGTLADGAPFQLSVDVAGGCSNSIEVGYAPSGCVPAASGCSTSYAPMNGTGGTYYGTAGSASTVWSVGTSTFTVFTGSSPTIYSPLTQQQVVLCTENGTTGRC